MTAAAPVNHAMTEPHFGSMNSKLNWLRAGVLGANDGIVSVAGLIIGVAATGASHGVIATAGFAAVASGAISMALGEYVSVSAQRDTEHALIAKEKRELAQMPEAEHAELVKILQSRGLTEKTAEVAACEMEDFDILHTHLSLELGIDQEDLANPWAAAFSSAISFVLGAIIPFIVVLISPTNIRIITTILATLVALALTGWAGARLGEAPPKKALFRLIIGGSLGLAITYLAGAAFGATGI